MNKWITESIAALLILLAMVAKPAVGETVDIEKSFSVQSGGLITIETDHGSIDVRSWHEDTVMVSVEKSARNPSRLDSFKLHFEKKGNNIFVEGDSSRNDKVKVRYVVKVPQAFNVDLNTGGGSLAVADLTGNIKLHTSGGSIKVGNITAGNVEADTSGGSIRVGDVDGDLKVNTSGGSIKVGKIAGLSSIDTSGGSITLEQGGANVNAETSGGSIKIGPVIGNVDVDTSGGSIKIAEIDGDVKAHTSGGSIKVKGSLGNVDIETSGGSLFVGSSHGFVKAQTSGGSIKILQARGYIEADTAGGKITAEMIQDDPGADTHVDLESSGGSITLYLPKSLAASVSARLKITRSAKRDYRIYSDFPLTIKEDDNDEITAKGEINGGGDKIKLNTVNGDIYIKVLGQ